MDDRIDIHNYGKRYEALKRKLRKDASLNPRNKQLILDYLRDSELGKTIWKGQKRKIGPARNLRVGLILLQMDRQWFQKPFDKITVKEMEDFILGIETGKIKNARGKPYTSESQMTIKKFIRKFWKWMKGDGKEYPREVEWMDTSGKQAEIQALPNLRKDVEKMVEHAPDYLKKAMLMTLFDSGTRVGEFLNMRLRDVEQLDDSENNDVLVVRIRHSKTFMRPVSLPLATPYLQKWLELHPDKNDKHA